MNPDKKIHTVEAEWLGAYCAGQLSTAKRLVLSCQAAVNPAIARRLDRIDSVGGVLLESASGEALSDSFISNLMGKIDQKGSRKMPIKANEQTRKHSGLGDWVPGPLSEFLEASKTPSNWTNMGFGMARLPLMQDGNEKLYLLKAKAGMKMPEHSHHGEEWALILQGGYHIGNDSYQYGDVHRENQDCTHSPIIDDHGEACITLVAAEGGVKFTNPVLRLIQPMFGI